MFGAEIASDRGCRLFTMKATLSRRIHYRAIPYVVVGRHLATLGGSSEAFQCSARLFRLEPPSSVDLMFKRLQ